MTLYFKIAVLLFYKCSLPIRNNLIVQGASWFIQ